jgi:hypothetical protein
MTAPAFTPAPWFVSGVRATIDRQRWIRVLQETPEKELAFIPFGDRTTEEYRQCSADANLIAAAPTMADYIQRKADEGDAEAARIMEAVHGNL